MILFPGSAAEPVKFGCSVGKACIEGRHGWQPDLIVHNAWVERQGEDRITIGRDARPILILEWEGHHQGKVVESSDWGVRGRGGAAGSGRDDIPPSQIRRPGRSGSGDKVSRQWGLVGASPSKRSTASLVAEAIRREWL